MPEDHDHAANSVRTLRAELADLRPKLAKVERERDDALGQLEILRAVCGRLHAERNAWMPKAEPAIDPYAGMCAPGTHRWKSQLQSTPDIYEWATWCEECGCQNDPREGD